MKYQKVFCASDSIITYVIQMISPSQPTITIHETIVTDRQTSWLDKERVPYTTSQKAYHSSMSFVFSSIGIVGENSNGW